jgi:nucleoside-diphosphate-sugar epimerase
VTRRILVTGGSGFLGRRVVDHLRSIGATIAAPGRAELDVAKSIFPASDFDVVVHLAARTYVPDSWADPEDFYRTNTLGTLRVLDYCRRTGASLVNISGYCYGEPSVLPTPEAEPLRPGNPYAFSKAAAELACQFYRDILGVNASTLRLFNLYGPGQPRQFLVPSLVSQAIDPNASAIVVGDTKPRRDYVHVDDVVSAIAHVVTRGAMASAYNVGSGQSHSVAEIARLICRAAGVHKELLDRSETRLNEIPETIADITAIRRDIGWEPRIGLADGLRAIVAAERAERRRGSRGGSLK